MIRTAGLCHAHLPSPTSAWNSCYKCINLQKCWVSHWPAKDVRLAFIDYFKNHHHEYYPPSSVIPIKGSGTFFTNAGMNQFKPIFMGTTLPNSRLSSIKRAVNSQKCIRLSGKHNDLADVGHDNTHHTFFEMLGNWSFGNYFKKEAIQMAWDLMTGVYGIPPDRLYVTYFGGEPSLSLAPDMECRELWLQIGIEKSRVIPGTMRDNFWEMGDTGPCGPCSEIHYDFVGGRDASHLVNADHPDVVELWNLVFMQYNRLDDKEMELLPNKHVDTGMGLERLVSVLQNRRSNYDTDLFLPLLNAISKHAQCGEYTGSLSKLTDISYRIVADHIRMMCVSIADGVVPANQGLDGLSPKLRQIMYRLFKHQRAVLGCPPLTSVRLVDPVVETLGEAFPELTDKCELIKEIVSREEDGYYEKVSDAYTLLSTFVKKHPETRILTDSDMDRLRDMGNNMDLTSSELLADIATDFGLVLPHYSLPTADSEPLVQPIRSNNSRLSSKVASQIERACIPPTDDSLKYIVNVSTEGEYKWAACEGKILAISHTDRLVSDITADKEPTDCLLILDRSCFYSESGGQAADIGHIYNQNCRLEVTDVQSHGQHVIHKCHILTGALQVGDEVTMELDQTNRTGCSLNHTATHLLGHCLKSKLSTSIQQAGSSITSDYFTFSFIYQGEIPIAELADISCHVNKLISQSIDLTFTELDYSQVEDIKGIARLPNHTYPSTVRVVSAGQLASPVSDNNIDFPAELCGGTHAANTSHIKAFIITGYSGQTQGVKRLTCVTGSKAFKAQRLMTHLEELTSRLISDVREEKQTDTWDSRLKDIYRLFGESHKLPKVEREILLNVLEQQRIPEIIRSRSKQGAKASLEQSIVKLLQGADSKPVVAQLKFNTAKDVAKIIRRLSPANPVFVYNTPDNSSQQLFLICYCPGNDQIHQWMEGISSELGGNLLPVKGKNLSNFYKIVLPAQTNLDILSDTIHGFQDLINKYREPHS